MSGKQARGSQLAITLFDETEYGQAPDPANGVRIYTRGCTLSSSQELQQDETLDPSRGRRRPDQGNRNVAGGLPMNQSAEGMAKLLKHAFGQVTTFRPVLTQPTNITGVTVIRAEKTAAPGDGTLTFDATGDTLTWAANGDDPGAAVDISAGGAFTLHSASANQALYVTVEWASLPETNESDTLTVVDAYEHEFTPGDLPTGLTIERDYGANISGSGRFEQFHGCRVGQMALGWPQNGYATAEYTFTGADSTLAASALDTDPADHGHNSFHTSYVTSLEEGGAANAVISEWNVTLDNQLDEDGFVLAGAVRGDLPEGMAAVSGSVTGLFKNTDLLNKAYNATDSKLRCVMKRGSGDGTAGNEYMETEVTDLVYERKSPEVSGPGGVRFNWSFQGFRSGTDLGLRMIVRNQVENP